MPPTSVVGPGYGHNVGVTLASPSATRVQLCGPLIVEQGSERLESRLPGRQGRQLFAYLVINRHRPVPRDQLIEALWPGQPPAAVDAALNALISKLRRALGPDVLEGRTSLRLRLESAWVDLDAATEAIHRAESSLARGECAPAWGPSLVALFVAEREFMPGEDAPWVDEQRRLLAEIRLRALECYAQAALGIGGTELVAAVRASRQLVRLAPLRETGHRSLMQALARQGNTAEALRVYTALCDTLRDELGISPDPATRALYNELVVA